jgi:hypothetical protein
MRIYITLLLVILIYPAFGQDTLVLKKGNVKEYSDNIVYNDSTTSGLPETFIADGIVEAKSMASCGYFCIGGTMKMQLLNPVTNYPYAYVYVATGCLTRINIGDKIHITVSKLRQTDPECYYHSFLQPLNSHGAPYYKLVDYKIN